MILIFYSNSSSSEAIGTREASVTETSPNSNSSSNLNRKASTVTSHSDIYDAIPHNDARNYYTESRPARIVQDILPPRVSSHGFANQSPHQTPISASGQNNERFSPTRSRNRTRVTYFRIFLLTFFFKVLSAISFKFRPPIY